MTLKLLIILSCVVLSLAGCRQYAYYQSPFLGATSSHKALPLRSEGIPAACYISGGFLIGGANQDQRDNITAFNGSFYRAHTFGYFRAYYGFDFKLGGYTVSPLHEDSFYNYNSGYPNVSVINARQGTKFFGGLGTSGGMYFTQPFDNGGEWRVFGVEFNWQHEYGHYLSFRRKLPADAANLISRNPEFFTIGIHTDFALSRRKGRVFGMKFGEVYSLGKSIVYQTPDLFSRKRTRYFSNTYYLTRNRITGSFQMNFGNWVSNVMFGFNYRL